LKLAADQNLVDAWNMSGECLWQGIGVMINESEAAKYSKFLDQNLAIAQLNYGRCRYQPIEVNRVIQINQILRIHLGDRPLKYQLKQLTREYIEVLSAWIAAESHLKSHPCDEDQDRRGYAWPRTPDFRRAYERTSSISVSIFENSPDITKPLSEVIGNLIFWKYFQ
jgi:hypothetical protein